VFVAFAENFESAGWGSGMPWDQASFSNYQFKVIEDRNGRGCVKAGQGPFDSGTAVKHFAGAPITQQ
jgi:hypothetical protein